MRNLCALVLLGISVSVIGQSHALDTPTLTAPSGSGNTTTPTISWTDVPGETLFDVWIDSVPAGQNPVYRNQNVVGTTITLPTALADNSSFNVYVRAGDGTEFSAWSAVQPFGTGTGPTAPPTGTPSITAPTGSGNTTTPTVAWTDVAGETYFDLWIDSVPAGASPLYRNQNVVGTSITLPAALANNSSFNTYVRAGNGFGFGPWSSAQSFATGTGPVGPPTGTPIVTTPTGSGNTTTPTVTWTDVAGETYFDIWIDSVPAGASPVYRNQNVVGTSITLPAALANNSSFNTYVRAANGFGFGPWSSAQPFATGTGPVGPPTGTPTITAPTGSGNTTTPTVTWTDVASEAYFDVWIDSVPAGASPVYRNQNVVGTSITLSAALADNSSFNTYVRAANSFGFGPWSSAQSFATGTGPVGPPTGTPTITAPTGSGNTTTPTVTWTDVAGETYFDVWIDSVPAGASPVYRNQNVVGTSITLPAALADNSSFNTYVRAGNGFGFGPWSSAQPFATGTGPVGPPTSTPTVTAPTGSGNTITPTVVWTDIAGETYFDVWIDSVPAGASPVYRNQNVVGTSITLPAALADNSSFNTYVRGGNGFGFGPWSSAQSFATGNGPVTPPTGVPTLLAPTGNGTALTPTFAWSAVSGSTLYDLWLDDTTTNTSEYIRQQNLTNTSFTPNVPLSPMHSYRWWVRGTNGFGAGPWSSEADFTTTSGLTVTPAQQFVTVGATDGNGAIVNYPPAIVVDGADPSPQVYYSRPSGSLFPVGNSQQVHIIATDSFGNVATATFNVTVTTISISMPNVTVPASDANGATVNFSAMVTDFVDAAPQVTYNPPSGSVFPIGSTNVTISVTDSVGGNATQNFTVNVQAIIVTHPDVTIVANNLSGASTDFASTPPTIVDPFDPAPTVSYADLDFPMGTTQTTVYVTDYLGNFASQAFNVTVVSPLTITPPADVFVLSTGNDSAIASFPNAVVVDVNDPSPFVNYSNFSGDLFPVGTTSVTITATDPLTFIQATATFNVVVGSTFEIVPPSDISIQATSPNGTVVNYPQPTVYDPADPNPVITFSQNSGSVFPLGTTSVTITGSDVLGNTESTSFNVTVNSAITITTPDAVVVQSTDPAGAFASYPAATVVDIADPSPVITYSQNSGTLFAPGVTPVTITATDAVNNSQTATFNVIVNTLSITPPADITVSATSANSAIVSYAATVVDPADASPVISYSQNSGTAFPIGTTAVAISATDSLGNSATALFNVTVTSSMTIVPPADPIVASIGGNAAYVTYPNATAIDPLDASPTLTYSIASPSYFNTGRTTVYVVATDKFGNSATASFHVIVTNSLSITPPADVFAVATSPAGANVSYPPPVIGNPELDAVTLTYSQVSGALFPIGTTTVNIFAQSQVGLNTAAASFHVTVAPPLAVSPPVDIAVIATDLNGAVVHYPPASVADTTDPSPTISYSIPNDSEFPLGKTTVSVLATDSAGSTATTSFNVTVYQPISITPPADVVVLAADANGAAVNFPAPQVYDTSDPSPAISYSFATGSIMPVGNTLVTVTATDASGFSASAYFTVSVVYFTITPPADVNISAIDPAGIVVSYPAATINTLITLPITVSYSQASGTLFPLGQNVVTVTAMDSTGDISTAAFKVNVHSLTIVPPANVVAEATGSNGTLVHYPPATVTDLFDPNPSVTYSPDINHPFPLGTTTVTVSALSASGDTATATFTVTIQDTTPPSITALADVPVFNSPVDGTTVYYPPAIVSDNADSNVTVTYSQNSGTVFPVGTTPVVVTVTDSSGNSTTYLFNVVVSGDPAGDDNTPPVIYNLQPSTGTVTNATQPIFSAGFYDGQSGVNVDTTTIFLDGVDVTTSAAISADGFVLLPPTPLSEGSHQLDVTISDNAANMTTASTVVKIVFSAPALTFDNEVNGVITFPADTVPVHTTPLVDEEFAANGSSIIGARSVRAQGVSVRGLQPGYGTGPFFAPTSGDKYATGFISGDNVLFTASGGPTAQPLPTTTTPAPGGQQFTIALPDLVPGVAYDVTAVVTDAFGNPSSYHVQVIKSLGTSNLNVQLSTPTDGQIFNSDSVPFSGTMNSTYAVGTTIRINIDGTQAVTASPTPNGIFSATAEHVPEGRHVIQAIAITSDNHAEASDPRTIIVDKTSPAGVFVDGPNDMVKYNLAKPLFFFLTPPAYSYFAYDVGNPPPWNSFTSPTWWTGTIDDVGSGTVAMDLNQNNPTPAYLQPTDIKGRQRWTGQIAFDPSPQFTPGGFNILTYRAQDAAGNLTGGSTLFQTSNSDCIWMPTLVGPKVFGNANIAIQKGNEILVGASDFWGNVVQAPGTSYTTVPTPPPDQVDDNGIPFGIPNANTIHLGPYNTPYGALFEAKFLRLKYDSTGTFPVTVEDLQQSAVGQYPDGSVRHYSNSYGFNVQVWDLPMELHDGAGNSISAADQKNGIVAVADSTNTPSITDPNLIKFTIHQPVCAGTVPTESINVNVYAPGAALGGGNARILVKNNLGNLVPQGEVPIPMSYIDPGAGLDLYVQVTSPSVALRDIAIVETYTPKFSYRNKTLVNAFWITAGQFKIDSTTASVGQYPEKLALGNDERDATLRIQFSMPGPTVGYSITWDNLPGYNNSVSGNNVSFKLAKASRPDSNFRFTAQDLAAPVPPGGEYPVIFHYAVQSNVTISTSTNRTFRSHVSFLINARLQGDLTDWQNRLGPQMQLDLP